MKIKSIVASAVVAATSSMSAFAVAPSALGTIDNTSVLIGNVTSDLLFIDLFTFNFANSGTLSSNVIAPLVSSPIPFFNTSYLNVKLYSGATVIGSDSDLTNGFNFSNLNAGAYSLIVGGLATGSIGGGYGGVITAENVTPVPEPESYAMLLAGLGVMGAIAFRRNKRKMD